MLFVNLVQEECSISSKWPWCAVLRPAMVPHPHSKRDNDAVHVKVILRFYLHPSTTWCRTVFSWKINDLNVEINQNKHLRTGEMFFHFDFIVNIAVVFYISCIRMCQSTKRRILTIEHQDWFSNMRRIFCICKKRCCLLLWKNVVLAMYCLKAALQYNWFQIF